MSCCGGSVYQPPTVPSAVTGVATAQIGTIYRVTTPQGIIYNYPQPWQAQQALAMRGGTLDIITPDQQ